MPLSLATIDVSDKPVSRHSQKMIKTSKKKREQEQEEEKKQTKKKENGLWFSNALSKLIGIVQAMLILSYLVVCQ